MLVLTRKIGETLVIDGPASVTILDIDRSRVKVGIEADRSVSVLRKELIDRDANSTGR